ncbi:THUMP-like domain-containing protein [Bifidobacterium leontopitheci]
MVDLTGGFGVDFSTMARAFAHAVYVERQPHLCALASHNFRALGLKHAQVVNETAEQWLAAAEQWLAAAERQAVAAAQQTAVTADSSAALAMAVAATAEQPIMPTADSSDSSAAFAELSPAAAPAVGRSSTASTPAAVSAGSPGAPSSSEPSPAASAPAASLTLIYLDPARRDAHGGRTYAIHDCTPDVLALKDRLLTLTPHVIVKLSPMLDWRKAVDDFRGAVREVHIVSVANECKELLLVLGRSGGETSDDGSRPVRVCCVNDDDRLAFDIIDGEFVAAGGADGGAPAGASGSVVPPDAARYLYEPNASIMKAGCFRLVEERYGVSQIGPNSHLMMAAEPVPDFPGRGFTVDAICGMGKKELKRALAGVKAANIAVRNFPLTAVQLRGKLKLRDGGDVYLFGTTDAAGRHVIVRAHK